MADIIDFLADEPAKMSACVAAMRVERGNTGRVLDSVTPEQCEASEIASDWFSGDDEAFLAHPGLNLFRAALTKVVPYPGTIYAFRGRPPDENGMLVLDPDKLGPHPLGLLNRYNRDGHPTLYLATSEQGVIAELRGEEMREVSVSIQEYYMDFSTLRVADMTSCELPPILAESFDRSERIFGARGKSDSYFRTNVLADEIRAAGFDGMVVPGVRGARGNRYKNIVIFDAGARWIGLRTSRPPFIA